MDGRAPRAENRLALVEFGPAATVALAPLDPLCRHPGGAFAAANRPRRPPLPAPRRIAPRLGTGCRRTLEAPLRPSWSSARRSGTASTAVLDHFVADAGVSAELLKLPHRMVEHPGRPNVGAAASSKGGGPGSARRVALRTPVTIGRLRVVPTGRAEALLRDYPGSFARGTSLVSGSRSYPLRASDWRCGPGSPRGCRERRSAAPTPGSHA